MIVHHARAAPAIEATDYACSANGAAHATRLVRSQCGAEPLPCATSAPEQHGAPRSGLRPRHHPTRGVRAAAGRPGQVRHAQPSVIRVRIARSARRRRQCGAGGSGRELSRSTGQERKQNNRTPSFVKLLGYRGTLSTLLCSTRSVRYTLVPPPTFHVHTLTYDVRHPWSNGSVTLQAASAAAGAVVESPPLERYPSQASTTSSRRKSWQSNPNPNPNPEPEPDHDPDPNVP